MRIRAAQGMLDGSSERQEYHPMRFRMLVLLVGLAATTGRSGGPLPRPPSFVILGESPFAFALPRQDPFRKVGPFLQLADPLLQLIELAKSGLEVLQHFGVRQAHCTGLGLRQESQQDDTAKNKQNDRPDCDRGPEHLARNTEHPSPAPFHTW